MMLQIVIQDEVIVQSFTFCASSHPITYLGATPVFVDSEAETWNMDLVVLRWCCDNHVHTHPIIKKCRFL